MRGTRVFLLAALLVLGAGEAAAQSRCYIWRDGRRVQCPEDDDRRDRERRRDEERRRREEASRRAIRRFTNEPASFGVRGGYDFQEDAGIAGAQFRIPVARGLAFSPSADVSFTDSETDWQVNTDALIRPPALSGLYGGLGAAFIHTSLDEISPAETSVGLNLILGLESGRIRDTTIRPFVEGRWTLVEDYDAFRLSAGFNVPVAGWR